jgi:hypothetical protein
MLWPQGCEWFSAAFLGWYFCTAAPQIVCRCCKDKLNYSKCKCFFTDILSVGQQWGDKKQIFIFAKELDK